MDLTIIKNNKIIRTKDVALSPNELNLLWKLIEESLGETLPIHSRTSIMKANGAVIYWLNLISKDSIEEESE